MATIAIDLKNGCEASHDKDGYKITRRAIVSGLTCTKKEGKIVEALKAVTDTYALFSTYPDDGTGNAALTGCILRSVTCVAVSGTTATVELIYSTRLILTELTSKYIIEEPYQVDTPTISYSAGLMQVQTVYDYNNAKVGLTFPRFVGIGVENADAYGFDTTTEGKNETSAVFTKEVPCGDMTITIRKATTYTAIKTEQNNFLNKVNDGIWLGDAAGTWKFQGLEARPDAAGTTWDITFHFSYLASGWNSEKAFHIKEDGKAPSAAEIARYTTSPHSYVPEATITKYATATFTGFTLFTLS